MMPMMLRQFELRSEIASGGMGTVYRAWDTTLGRELAVKLMKQELVDDEAAVTSFAVEARACAQLNHTNIIHIYTFDEHEGYRYLAMELAVALGASKLIYLTPFSGLQVNGVVQLNLPADELKRLLADRTAASLQR